jgi:phosphoribosylglycinamide formyltransferase-1
VHLVDEVYDNGPILLQRWCPVETTDSAADLAARVFAEELIALPEALRRFWSR